VASKYSPKTYQMTGGVSSPFSGNPLFATKNFSYKSNFGTNSNQSNSDSAWSSRTVSARTISTVLGVGFAAAATALYLRGDFDDDRKAAHAAFGKKEPPSENLAQGTVVSQCHPVGAFVIITLNSTKTDQMKEVAKAVSKLPQIVKNLTPEDYKPKPDTLPPVMAGVAFSTTVWEQFCKDTKKTLPKNLTHHKERTGKFGTMPNTGGHIFLHVKAETRSLCYETVKAFVDSLPKGSVAKVDDEYSFQFQDGRDLSGFLDGTENPADTTSRRAAALLDTGGSYVIHQRWVHDLAPFHAKPKTDQEKVVGRSKEDSAEMNPLPKSSHVARMRTAKGEKIPIVRQSMPYGKLGTPQGLLFIAYSNEISKFDQMLDQMIGKGHGTENDDIMSFSKCIASNYYYVPSAKELTSLA